MRPTQFYQKQYIKDLTKTSKKSITGKNAEFPFYNGTLNMAFINEVDAPTPEAIAKWQIATVKDTFMINPIIKAFLASYDKNKISFSNIKGMGGVKNLDLEDALKIINSVLGNTSVGYNKSGKVATHRTDNFNLLIGANNADINDTSFYKSYKQLAIGLGAVNKLFTSDEAFVSTPEMLHYIKIIQTARDKLNSDLSKIEKGLKVPSEPYIPENVLSDLKKKVQGRFVETAVLNYLQQVLPQEIIALDVANVQGNYGKKLRTDTLFIDISNTDLFKTIQIKWKQKKAGNPKAKPFIMSGTLADFFDILKNNQSKYSITIDDKTVDEIYKASSAGIQAKSGVNQNLINQNKKNKFNKISINNLKSSNSIYYQCLHYFSLWYEKGKHINTTNEIFNNCFDYCLSHLLQQLIGTNNGIVATRDGVMTTYQYLSEQWAKHHKYLKAMQAVSIMDESKTIPVGLSSKHNKYAERYK